MKENSQGEYQHNSNSNFGGRKDRIENYPPIQKFPSPTTTQRFEEQQQQNNPDLEQREER
ncbi:hypothetical protein C922_05542 [Plasmodium inui San Antonio 1]|uniref:Uncharacterized protein n=1 Tax=Plasmodium inui San Antonio 1 TaxID=1237626 RepID=W7A4R0_9APIC|nr:hypothetical protein C922_05542 [Plasmodium inui San Antonio 1]EUD64079.1 hypothetical protein C922_05542 [Plasmodium inui San Antonio 1]